MTKINKLVTSAGRLLSIKEISHYILNMILLVVHKQRGLSGKKQKKYN